MKQSLKIKLPIKQILTVKTKRAQAACQKFRRVIQLNQLNETSTAFYYWINHTVFHPIEPCRSQNDFFFAAKCGHTGTLDPMATGLLPLCFGEATKFSSLLLGANKTYEATLKLGFSSTTGDAEGEISQNNCRKFL